MELWNFIEEKLKLESDGSLRRVKRLVVHSTYKNNVDCPYYYENQDLTCPEPSSVMEVLRNAVGGGIEWIVFAGGEPLLDRNLNSFAENIRLMKRGLKIEVRTNALLCEELSFAERLKDSGVTNACVLLPTRIQDTYRRMMACRVSLESAVKGMLNLEKVGMEIEVSVVLTRENMSELPELVSFVHQNLRGASIEAAMVVPERIKLDISLILPEFSDLKEHIVSAVNRAISLKVKFRLAGKEAPPPCIFYDTPDHMLAVEFRKETGNETGSAFVKPGVCATCALNEFCFGVRKSYLDVYGDSELKPVNDKLAADLINLKFPPSGRRFSGLELIKIRRERRRGVVREL